MENKNNRQRPAPIVCDNCGALNDPRNRSCYQCKYEFYPERQQAYYPDHQQERHEPAAKKRSKISLAAMILGILASIFCIVAIGDATGSTSSTAEEIGMAIGMAMIMPSVLLVIVGAILNIIGYFTNSRVLTLISAITYTLGLLAFPMWGFVAIPSLILQFVAFAKMPKRA